MEQQTLKLLAPALPTGEDVMGFAGDASGSDKYVTDGHLLLLRSAIKPAALKQIKRLGGPHPSERSIETVWNPAKTRKVSECWFIGCADLPLPLPGAQPLSIAIVRDAAARIMALNAFLFRFAVRSVFPDSLWVATGAQYFSSPLLLKDAGELVGVLMPMHYSGHEFSSYDLEREAIPTSDL